FAFTFDRSHTLLDARGVRGALTFGSGAPSRGWPSRTLLIRAIACWVYSCDSSNPSHFRPSFLATANVVPEPANGSRTTSPGFEQARMIRPRSCSGIWHPWNPILSLKVPATRGKYHV